jgi:uncharacterized protein YkwD
VSHPLNLCLALVLVALSVAGALAHPPPAAAAACAHANAVRAQASRAEVGRAIVCEINAERRSHGLSRLTVNSQLSAAARRHSLDMVQRRYFSHIEPSGVGLVQRIDAAGYLTSVHRWLVGETLAWGWGAGASPIRIVQAWMHSPEHRRVVLRSSYREVGLGVAWGGPRPRSAPEATFTADFGVTN